MVTEMVMDCSLNHDNSNGSSASNAGSPRPPTASEGANKAPAPLSPSGAQAGGGGPRSEQDMYNQRSPSPQGPVGSLPQSLHSGGFDASTLGRQHLGHMPASAQLSPPMQSAMMHPRMHLGPPGLGLFNSLVQHAGHSPLELMAAAQAQAQAQAHQHGHQGHPGHPNMHPHGPHGPHGPHPPRSYNSPPPISSSDPTANECKLVAYRGHKVAAFMINGETMLCLPQAFELFLKHLVGGLHTVYTKLKRLDIVPLVCNVEQVRILRGLGAIQPGVNRCKLLSCKDFDTLYRDCTTARCLTSHRTPDSRPGRPPKRVPMGLSLPASLQGHPQLKKPRLENGDFAPFENGPMGENRMEKSPLLSNGYNAPPTHLHPMHPFYHTGLPHPALKGQGAAPLEAIRSGIWEDCRAAYEDIVKTLGRLRDGRGETDPRQPGLGSLGSLGSPGEDFSNGHSPVLNLSKGTAGSAASAASVGSRGSRASAGSAADHSDSEAGASDKDDDDDLNSNPDEDDDEKDTKPLRGSLGSPGSSPPPLPTNLAHLTVGVGVAPLAGLGASLGATLGSLGGAKASVGGDPRLTSTETILRNIEGLLQVAADNARQQERQINIEKAELKMDVIREREVKESLERQLQDETRTRVLCQKRLKKVRRASRRLQEQLELEMKRRSQLEEVLRTTGASSEALRILTEMKASSSASTSEMTSPRSSPVERGSASPGVRPQSQPQGLQGLQGLQGPQSQNPAQRSFWQNYSENLAQELENERKAKLKQKDQQTTQQTTQEHRQQLMHDNEAIAMDLDSKPLVQDLRWPTEHRAAIIS